MDFPLILSAFCLLFNLFFAKGQFSGCDVATYYSGLSNFPPPSTTPTTAAQLKSTLHDLIDGHNRIPFTQSDEAMEILDRDPNNATQVLDVYRDVGVPYLFFSGNTGQQSNVLAWNREHVWPRSRGIDDSGDDDSDLFNLRPCNARLNSARGNSRFTNCVGCPSPASTSSIDGAPDTAEGTDEWLPPTRWRGDIARSLMYMVVRYDGSDSSTTDLEFTNADAVADLQTMLEWHRLDPVDSLETQRVDGICELFQGNRNPFVDFPELVDLVFGSGTVSPTVSDGPGIPSTGAPVTAAPATDDNTPVAAAPATDDTPVVVGVAVAGAFLFLGFSGFSAFVVWHDRGRASVTRPRKQTPQVTQPNYQETSGQTTNPLFFG